MTSAFFLLRTAARSIQRSGQRSVLAIACVAFGVFSLVSLQLLSASVSEALLVPPRLDLGGDLALRPPGDALTDADLEALRADPALDGVERVGRVEARFLQTAATSRIVLFERILAVDPNVFPLVGDLTLRGGGALADALAEPGSVVLTRDLARRAGVEVGNRVRLAGGTSNTPAVLTVTAIARTMPDAKGATLVVGLATARAIRGEAPVPQTARVLTKAPASVRERYEGSGWTVQTPQAAPDDVDRLFGIALPAAGLLGLLVGGIGVANTLQVMLSRRRTEIATLKTLGYRQRDLVVLFSAETALLGLAGGVLGVLGGLAGALALQRVMTRSMSFLLSFSPSPWTLLGGLAAGMLTALVFGWIAIARSSKVRPSSLLRQTSSPPTRRTRIAVAALSGLLFATFGLIGSGLVGSFATGFGAIAAGVGGLVVFGAMMVGVLLLVVRLPVPGLPLLRMAMRNLRRQPVRAATSLVALFVGTFAIGISTMAILNGQAQVAGRAVEVGQANLVAYGIDRDDPALRAAADGAPVWVDRRVAARVRWTDGTAVAALASLSGRAADGQGSIDVAATPGGERGKAWLTQSGEALVPWHLARSSGRDVAAGDTLLVEVAGTQTPVTICGFYDRSDGVPLVPTTGVVVLPSTFDALVPDAAAGVETAVALEVPPERLDAVATELGAAHPDAVLISGDDLVAMLTGLIRSLFLLVLALTSLALVAGTVLVANGVGLALVERTRELGVLKAIGYSSAQVLRTVVLENAILGAIAGGLGVGATLLTLQAIAVGAETDVQLYPGVAVALVAVSVALAAGSALAVAWRPVRARPLDVLRGA